MERMQRIATCLMFVGDQCGRAEEAMDLYVSLFDDSRVLDVERFGAGEQESGVKHARFVLAGREHIAMDSGGAHPFTFTPAMSLFVDCDSERRLEEAFTELSDRGTVLMALQAYPFSAKFGWLADRFGVSWQLNLAPAGAPDATGQGP
jgi:predicted 3-demethylubiquinone-9 3-methyltransferase (glyoxalase superfamily)